MANDLTTNEQADGRPPLAVMASSRRPWMIDDALALVGSDPQRALADARHAIARAFDPVPTNPAMRAEWKMAMDERLRRIALKIAPGMTPAQTEPWRELMADVFSDLPAMIALTAVKRAFHKPMKFMNEIEGVVRDLAADVITEQRRARARLDDVEAAINRPRRAALPPQEEGAPFSADEVRKMAPEIRRMGIAGGWISAELLTEAYPDGEPVESAPPVIEYAPTLNLIGKRGAARLPTDADYAALGITPDQLAASRASDEAEAAAAAARPRVPVTTHAACPVCRDTKVKVEGRYGICESIDCGEMWEIDQTMAA